MPTGAYRLSDVQPAAGSGAYRLADATPPPISLETAQEPDWVDKVTDWLPAIGGTVGGVVGTAGGPVGSVGGAALGGMAGEAYKELITRARGRPAPRTMTAAATQIGTEGAIQGGAQAVGEAVIAPAARVIGARIMQSAVKPGLKLLTKSDPGATPEVVKTLMKEGVNVTSGGVAKLQRLLSANRQEIAAAIAPAKDVELPTLRVAARLTDVARRFGNQVNPNADLEAISNVGENFLAHPAISDAGTLTLQQAQALKQGTYQQVAGKYGQQSAATIEAEKALARGLKEDIAAEVPGLDALNERQGKLLTALDAVGKRAALAGNRDPIGFAWVAHNPTMFLAALIDRSPAIKSLLARGLYNHAGEVAKVPPVMIRIAVHAMTTADEADAAPATSTDPGNPR